MATQSITWPQCLLKLGHVPSTYPLVRRGDRHDRAFCRTDALLHSFARSFVSFQCRSRICVCHHQWRVNLRPNCFVPLSGQCDSAHGTVCTGPPLANWCLSFNCKLSYLFNNRTCSKVRASWPPTTTAKLMHLALGCAN